MGKIIVVAVIFYIIGAMYPSIWNTVRAKTGI